MLCKSLTYEMKQLYRINSKYLRKIFDELNSSHISCPFSLYKFLLIFVFNLLDALFVCIFLIERMQKSKKQKKQKNKKQNKK